MSVSPKHSTPFSVTDILNPIEELQNFSNFNLPLRKTTFGESGIPGLGAYSYRGSGSQAGVGSMNTMSAMSMPVTYHNYVPPLSHHTPSFTSQYCNSGDYYPDPMMRNGTNWYNAGSPDHRLTSKFYKDVRRCINKQLVQELLASIWHSVMKIYQNIKTELSSRLF